MKNVMRIIFIFFISLVTNFFAGDADDYYSKYNKAYHSGIEKEEKKLEAAKESREKSIKELTGKYQKALEKILTLYTKEGKLDKAVKVRNEIKQLKQLLDSGKTPEAETAAKPTDELTEKDMEKALGYDLRWHPVGAKKGPNGHWYKKYQKADYTFSEAMALCKKLGGYLATSTSKEENDFIHQLDPGAGEERYRLGGVLRNGQWTWVTGEKWSYSHWGRGQPSGRGETTITMFNQPGIWNDEHVLPKYGLVVEWNK